MPAWLKAFGATWLKFVVVGIVFAVVSGVWAKIRAKRKTESANRGVESGEE